MAFCCPFPSLRNTGCRGISRADRVCSLGKIWTGLLLEFGRKDSAFSRVSRWDPQVLAFSTSQGVCAFMQTFPRAEWLASRASLSYRPYPGLFLGSFLWIQMPTEAPCSQYMHPKAKSLIYSLLCARKLGRERGLKFGRETRVPRTSRSTPTCISCLKETALSFVGPN